MHGRTSSVADDGAEQGSCSWLEHSQHAGSVSSVRRDPARVWNGRPHGQRQSRLGGVFGDGPGTDAVPSVLQQSTCVRGQDHLPELTLLAYPQSPSPWAMWPGPHTKQVTLTWPPLAGLLHSHRHPGPAPHRGAAGGQATSPGL